MHYNTLILWFRRVSSILLFCFSICLFSVGDLLGQAPESMNYQAVIRDGSGDLVASQSVGIRINLLKGNASGTNVYEETYAVNTDAYGLVNLQLGTGTVQSGTFSSIDWGDGPYFVETAVDVAGGTSYNVISTTQFMSVPYALYANKAGLDSAAIQGMIDAAGGSGGSSGSNLIFPDGLSSDAITHDLNSGSYTVPSGKTLYILNRFGTYNSALLIDGKVMSTRYNNTENILSFNLPIIVKSGEVVSYQTEPSSFNGFLVSSGVTALTHDLNDGDYTVPNGKTFYLLNRFGTYNSALLVDGKVMSTRYNNTENTLSFNLPLIIKSGEIISSQTESSVINGYLVDENFFESSSSGSNSGFSSGNPGGSLLNSVNVPMVESYNLNTTNYNYGDIVFDISNDELKILKMQGSATNSFFTSYPNPCNDGGSNRQSETYYVSFQVLDTIVINSMVSARYLSTNWSGSTYACNTSYDASTNTLYENPDTTTLIDNVSNLGTLIQNSSPLFPGRIYTIQLAPFSASYNYGNVTVTNNSLYTVNASFFKNIKYGKLSSSSIVNTSYFPYIKSGSEYFFKFSEPQKTWLTIGP